MEQRNELMRGWYSGCALAFQASETGSIPVPRSKLLYNKSYLLYNIFLTIQGEWSE